MPSWVDVFTELRVLSLHYFYLPRVRNRTLLHAGLSGTPALCCCVVVTFRPFTADIGRRKADAILYDRWQLAVE